MDPDAGRRHEADHDQEQARLDGRRDPAAAARSGTGITGLPSFISGRDLREGKLVSLFPEHHAGTLEIYALHPHRRFVPTKVRTLIDFLAKRLNADGQEDPWDRTTLIEGYEQMSRVTMRRGAP